MYTESMKKVSIFLSPVITILLFTGLLYSQKTDSKPGFTITVDGDQFNNQTFFIPASVTTYENQYWDFKADPRAKRTVLGGFKPGNSLQMQINVPIHKTTGSYTFIEDSIPVYMGFQFTREDKNYQSTTYFPGRITVTITHYGNVGEMIEGNFSGKLHSGEKEIKISGTFKVKRIKDRN